MEVTLEYKSLAYRVIIRFAKAFALGFIGGLLTVPALTDFTLIELQTYGLALINAGIFGGLMALEKLLRK